MSRHASFSVPTIGLAAVIAALPLSAEATVFRTFITGEAGGAPTIFQVDFDPTVKDSAVVKPIVAAGFGVDGIDFVPGTSDLEVVIGAPGAKKIAHFDVFPPTGALPDFVPDTDAVAVAPGTPGTNPSSVLSTATHVYYTENQFGFGATASHRIMRKPFAAGPEEVVFDAADPDPDAKVAGKTLENFEGLEIVDGRLYFHARDPADPTKRALLSIALAGGVWDPAAAPTVHVGGLAASGAPVGAADGSDELDHDAGSDTLFGTNIVNGEVVSVSLGGAIPTGIFVSGAAVGAGAADALGLLGREIDGIRSDGLGHLIFVGRGGVMGAIDIAGVVADGADDGDVLRLFDAVVAGKDIIFDDLTPLTAPVPEPATVALLAAALAGLRLRRRPLG